LIDLSMNDSQRAETGYSCRATRISQKHFLPIGRKSSPILASGDQENLQRPPSMSSGKMRLELCRVYKKLAEK